MCSQAIGQYAEQYDVMAFANIITMNLLIDKDISQTRMP